MRLFRLFLVISLVLMASTAALAAEDEEAAKIREESHFSFAQEFDFSSQYVWRGFAFSRGAVLQPESSLGIYDFTLTLWANFVLNNEPGQGRFNEVDPSVDYHLQFGNLELQPSFEYYLYPNQTNAPSTGETSLWIAYTLGPVQFFTDQIVDVVHNAGAYYGDFGLQHERTLIKNLDLTVSGTLGWASSKFNSAYAGAPKTALNVFLWDLELTYRPMNHFYLRPHMQVSVLIDPDLRTAATDPTIVSGGLALGVTF